jgi:hypothetical protein
VQGQTAELALPQAPVVLLGSGGAAHLAGEKTSAAAPLVLVGALLLAVAQWQRRRMP